MQPRAAPVWPARALQPGGLFLQTFDRTALACPSPIWTPPLSSHYPLARPRSSREPRVTPVTGRLGVEGLKVSVQPIRKLS